MLALYADAVTGWFTVDEVLMVLWHYAIADARNKMR